VAEKSHNSESAFVVDIERMTGTLKPQPMCTAMWRLYRQIKNCPPRHSFKLTTLNQLSYH
jgi:hypothetical protein